MSLSLQLDIVLSHRIIYYLQEAFNKGFLFTLEQNTSAIILCAEKIHTNEFVRSPSGNQRKRESCVRRGTIWVRRVLWDCVVFGHLIVAVY